MRKDRTISSIANSWMLQLVLEVSLIGELFNGNAVLMMGWRDEQAFVHLFYNVARFASLKAGVYT